jgi:hypothetical protein
MEHRIHHPIVPEFVCEYASRVTDGQGRVWRARTYGVSQGTGVWDGWLVFFPEDGVGPLLRTDEEAEEISLEDLSIWARAITPDYLERALKRAHPFLEAAGSAEAAFPQGG